MPISPFNIEPAIATGCHARVYYTDHTFTVGKNKHSLAQRSINHTVLNRKRGRRHGIYDNSLFVLFKIHRADSNEVNNTWLEFDSEFPGIGNLAVRYRERIQRIPSNIDASFNVPVYLGSIYVDFPSHEIDVLVFYKRSSQTNQSTIKNIQITTIREASTTLQKMQVTNFWSYAPMPLKRPK